MVKLLISIIVIDVQNLSKMKKLFIVSAIAISGLIYNTAKAQISVNLGFHISPRRVYTAPAVVEEAPVYNDNNDDYYYLPDVDAYYSVNEQCYYYFDGDNWIAAAYLPGAYRDYDWRNAPRFEVREARPYLHNDIYRSRYNGNTENASWERHDNYSNAGYASVGYSNNGYRGGDQHFGNRGQSNYSQPTQSNKGQGSYSQPQGSYMRQGGNDQHFGNRGQSTYSQPAQPNRGQGGSDQHYGNRSQGSSAQPNRGQDHGNRGGNSQGNQSSPRGGYSNHSMTRS